MITKLVVENVLPFRGRVELDLADRGLVLVRARNEVSEAADSNGSGKTSLLHAICLGYFGVDLVGRRADAVACRFTEGPGVIEIHNADALGAWGVRRQFRPSKLTTWGIPGVLENEDIAVLNEKVAQRLGLGLRTFKNAVVFGQGAFERFAQAGQDEQMRMLDEIQGVDFREALKRAQTWRKGLTERLGLERQASNEVIAKLDGLARVIASLATARDAFESERAAQVERLRSTVSAAEARVAAVRGEFDVVQAAGVCLAKLVVEQAKADACEAERKNAEFVWAKADGLCEQRIRRLKDFVDRLDALAEDDACPTCRQPVKSRKAAIRKLFDADLVRLTGESDDAELAVAKAKKVLDALAGKLMKQMARLDAAVPGGEDAGKYIAGLRNLCDGRNVGRLRDSMDRAEAEVARAITEVEVVRATAWFGQESLTDAERERVELATVQDHAERQLGKIEAAVRMADYCVEAFGDRGIRSLLVDGVADFVNERVAAHLEVLAAGEATVRMSATTDLKKGGARERISFKTEWAWGGDGPLDGSGGQDRREDLALFAAVQDLAESRSARPFPIKIFDEPFDALDSRGKELAAAWVRGIARSRGTALLVTHSEELAQLAEPDVTWTVVMTREGATVEVS
jgi:DNA repair exonuclease SbcCD ATPase subunit